MQHRPPQSNFRGGRVPRGIYAYGMHNEARFMSVDKVNTFVLLEKYSSG